MSASAKQGSTPAARRSPRRRALAQVLGTVALAALTAAILFPIFVALATSLKPAGEVITAEPRLLPSVLSFDNYTKLFGLREFPVYLLNSVIVASLTSFATLLVAIPAACALVWLRFPGRRIISESILFTYMFPSILLVIPLFLMSYRLGLIDTRFGLIVTYLSITLPFSIWMLKGFFESISVELLETALLEGCTYTQALVRVILPVSLPGVAAVVVFCFVLGWSEYLFAATFISSDSNRTVIIGLQTLLGYYRVDYGLLTAAGMVVVAPVALLFLAAQRFLAKGLVVGAVKE